jgi:hypothetical protein
MHLDAMISVINGTGFPTTGLGSDHKLDSLLFQNCPRPNLLGLVGPNPNMDFSTHGFCWVWLNPSITISSSVFRDFYFWLDFDILLLIANY